MKKRNGALRPQHNTKRAKNTRKSVHMQRRRHEIYRDLVNDIAPGTDHKEYGRLQREAADKAGI
ncbi:MAG: hypothetical protein CML06_21060 [Pseudomonadales bacterium]|nr:hypothetical protein [Pseudomonadales bacterium]